MATSIPAFVSQVQIPASTNISVTGGTAQAVPSTRLYYLVSNRTTTSDGQSLLKAVKDTLDASNGDTAWTVSLSASSFKVQISHDNGSSRTVNMDATLAAGLGFSSAIFSVSTATTVTAANLSYWWWSPNMPVSMTGPTMFDPALSFGVPTSAGSAQRSSDMTAAYVSNGIQYEAEYTFTGIDGYYRVKPVSGFTNQDFETWWQYGPRLGRRVLMWRNRSNATGSNAPSEGSASPWNYVEYTPQPELRSGPPIAPLSANNLVYWTVRLPLWLTPNVDTPMTD